MTKLDYVYVTYINSTPEAVWDAITKPEITRQYWFNHRNASDWQAGSAWQHEDYDDANSVDIVGTVLASEPPHRLVLTWADPDQANDQTKYSEVTIDITPDRGVVRVQVSHRGLEEPMHQSISFGWPLVLSNLKTLLETGNVLLKETQHSGCASQA